MIGLTESAPAIGGTMAPRPDDRPIGRQADEDGAGSGARSSDAHSKDHSGNGENRLQPFAKSCHGFTILLQFTVGQEADVH